MIIANTMLSQTSSFDRQSHFLTLQCHGQESPRAGKGVLSRGNAETGPTPDTTRVSQREREREERRKGNACACRLPLPLAFLACRSAGCTLLLLTNSLSLSTQLRRPLDPNRRPDRVQIAPPVQAIPVNSLSKSCHPHSPCL